MKPLCCFKCGRPGELFGIGEYTEGPRAFIFKHPKKEWCFVPFAIDGGEERQRGLSKRKAWGARI